MQNIFKAKRRNKKGSLGFTLIEVLVAIAILALLAIPLAQSMITSAQLNSQSKNVGSASDMAQTVAESMQATQLGTVLTEINGYTTNSVGYEFYNATTGEGYSFLNNALQGYSVDESYEVMLLCPGCNARLSSESLEDKACEKCSAAISDANVKYVPVKRQNSPGVTSDADVTSSIKTRTTKDNIVRTYFTGNADDTYDFVLRNIATDEANFDVLVHVEPEQSLQIANISSMSSSNLVNIVEKKTLDKDVAETFFQAHQMYCMLRHTATTLTLQDFQSQMTRSVTIDIRNDAIRGTTVITVKAVYTAPEGTVDTADKYITKTIGSFTTNSTAEIAEGVYFYFYPLRESRDIITVNNPDAIAIKVYLIAMDNGETGPYHPHLQFSDLTPANAASTTIFCSNLPESDFASLPAGATMKTLSNITEQQTLYSMDVKVYTHKDSSFDSDGVFTPDDKYLIIDTNATLLDSSEKFDVNVDAEFGNPIPDEDDDPDAPPGEGDDEIDNAPNRGYAEAGGQNFVYSGDEYNVTIVGGLPGGADMGKFVEWSGEITGTNAGTYIAYAKPISGHTWPNGTTGKRQISWTISRKPASTILPQNAVYDAEEHVGYTNEAFVTLAGDIVKTDAGHYIIYVTPEPNYSWLDDGSYNTREITWTISPRPITLTWKTGEGFDTWQYDGNPHSGQCVVDETTLPAVDRGGKIIPNIRDNRIVEVGKILAKVTSLNNPNYALPTQGTTHELTVYGAAVSTVTMKNANNGVDSLIYNGQEQTGLAFSEGVAITGISHAIDAGSYVLTATPLPGYAWDAAGNDRAPRDFPWSILQKEVTVQWGQLEWNYDGITHSTTCDITNLIPDTICEVEIANNAILDAGEQPVTATLTNKNYKFPDTPSRDQSPNQILKVYALKDATYTMSQPVIYDGQTYNWGTGTHIQITGVLSETEAGTYRVEITPTKNHTWTDGTTTTKTETWTIKHAEMSKVFWDNYCYTGLEIIGVTNQYCDWGAGQWKATAKNTYTIQVTPSKNYAWARQDEFTYTAQDRATRTITWKIVGNTVVKPDPDHALLNFGDPITSFEYNGQTWSPLISTIDGTLPLTDAVFQKNPYYEVTGTTNAIEVGNYTAVIKLKDKNNSTWSTGGTDDVVINWSITKRKITLYTIPHLGTQTYYNRDTTTGDNSRADYPVAYGKTWDGSSLSNQLKLKLASSATATDGDIWLTKDEFPKYDFDYKPSIQETSPLAKDQKITFAYDKTNNLWNSSTPTQTCDKQSDAGVYVYCVIPTIKDAKNKDVTHNYEITYDFSYLMITKVPAPPPDPGTDPDPEPEDPDYPWPNPLPTDLDIQLLQNATVYNGKDQSLLTVRKVPNGYTIKFTWEHIGYSAASSYSSAATLTGKTSKLPGATSGFTKDSTNSNFSAKGIYPLVGRIDNLTQQAVRPASNMWTATVPTGAVQSNGNNYVSTGTQAGKYAIYYYLDGDANHEDVWLKSYVTIIDVAQAEQTIHVDNSFDKCHNHVYQTVTTRMQEKPVISYAANNYVETPSLNSNTATSTNVSNHAKATGSKQVTGLKSNGRVGNTTITIQAAATENYKKGSASINIYCRDHLHSGVVRDSLYHQCSGACSLGTHSPGSYAPTCTATGNWHYDCQECGEYVNETRAKLGHAVSTSGYGGPWCTNDRGYTYSCSRCSYSGTVSYGAPYGAHNYEAWNAKSDYHYRRCMNVLASRTVYWTDSNGVQHSAQVPTVRCLYSDGNFPHSPWTWNGPYGCCYKDRYCNACGNRVYKGQSSHHSYTSRSWTSGRYRYTERKCGCCGGDKSTTYQFIMGS